MTRGPQVVVGETGVSNNETTTVCTPAGALFAAGDVLSWLAAGAHSVDWWDMNNYGNTGAACTNPDYGMFTSGSPPVPETPYYGYVLASVLAQPHALLASHAHLRPGGRAGLPVLLPGGQEAVAFINTNTSAAQTVRFHPGAPLAGQLQHLDLQRRRPERHQLHHRPGHYDGLAGRHLPAESMVIFESQR